MKNLTETLMELNSNDESQGIWIDPDNPNDYRFGSLCLDNGGVIDNKIFIGTLKDLSFGAIDRDEAVEQFLAEHDAVFYKERYVRINSSAMYEAYRNGRIDLEFATFLENEAEYIVRKTSVESKASNFVDKFRKTVF